MRQRQADNRWPLGSPGEWLAEGHVTCAVRCTSRKCNHYSVDIKLDTLPLDKQWSVLGPRMACSQCRTVGSVNVIPNWHDRAFEVKPLVASKKPPLG